MILYFILFIITLSILGLVSEEIMLFIQSKNLKPPGIIIKASRGYIHVSSKGCGSTTVVLSSGYGVPSPYCDFYKLQDDISKFTKTALYERYGYGYSDDISNGIDLDSLVDDIRLSLKKSGHSPPYIFLVHSAASVEILRYAQMYPYEVMGIVMEDALNPEMKDIIPIPSTIILRTMQYLKFTGFLRLALKIPSLKNQMIDKDSPKEFKKLKTKLTIRNYWNENMVSEMKGLRNNCSIVLNNGMNFNDLPIRIIKT